MFGEQFFMDVKGQFYGWLHHLSSCVRNSLVVEISRGKRCHTHICSLSFLREINMSRKALLK